MRARSAAGTRTAAEYVNLAPGESWHGRMDLQVDGWGCVGAWGGVGGWGIAGAGSMRGEA